MTAYRHAKPKDQLGENGRSVMPVPAKAANYREGTVAYQRGYGSLQVASSSH